MSSAPNMQLVAKLRSGRRLMMATGPGKIIRNNQEQAFRAGQLILLGATGGVLAGPIGAFDVLQDAQDILNAAEVRPDDPMVAFAALIITITSEPERENKAAAHKGLH